MAAAAWIVYAGLGFGALYLMKYTGSMLDALLVRVAACLFAAAGTIGATGWIGNLIHSFTTTVDSTGNQVTRSAVGSAVMWLVWFLLGLLWILCILPERWFKRSIPDWLSVSGLVLPAGLATVPGPAGVALLSILTFAGNLVMAPARALFGG